MYNNDFYNNFLYNDLDAPNILRGDIFFSIELDMQAINIKPLESEFDFSFNLDDTYPEILKVANAEMEFGLELDASLSNVYSIELGADIDHIFHNMDMSALLGTIRLVEEPLEMSFDAELQASITGSLGYYFKRGRRGSYLFPSDPIDNLNIDSIDEHYKIFRLLYGLGNIKEYIENIESNAYEELRIYGIEPNSPNPIYVDPLISSYVGTWKDYKDISGNMFFIIKDNTGGEIKISELISGERRFVDIDTTSYFFKPYRGMFGIYLGDNK